MIMVPCQHETISDIVRDHGTPRRSNRCRVCERDDQVIQRLMQRGECGGHGSGVECCHHGEQQRALRAHVFGGAPSARRSAAVERCTPSVPPQGQCVGAGDGGLTGVMRGVLALETLGQRGLAVGTGKQARGIGFVVNGRRGCAFHGMQHLTAVAQRLESLRPPQGHVARGPVAGHAAQTAIGGPAKTGALVRLERCTMGAPGIRRAC